MKEPEEKAEEWAKLALSLDAEPPEGLRLPTWVRSKLSLTRGAPKRSSR